MEALPDRPGQDPGITFRRILSIFSQGTSLHKFEVIHRGIFGNEADYAARYSEEMAYLGTLPANTIDVVPYPLKGKPIEVVVERDEAERLDFIRHGTKKLYFPDTMSASDAASCYRSLMEGEDIFGRGRVKSPHCYQDEMHRVCEGDVVIDVGSAEGLFALDVAEKAGRIYLFELLPRWNRPLRLSFAPFADKTVIVNKQVSDRTEGESVRLSDAIRDDGNAPYFIKMDIEGWEKTVLEASEDFLRSHRVKISCCTYHRQRDAREISEYLSGLGFRIRYSEGYMIPPLDKVEPPYFRKAMLYAQNF